MTYQLQQKTDRRIKPRYEIKIHARIEAQLIGSSFPVEFVTENLSESGLLLTYSAKEKLIFNESSILETWLYPNEGEPIFFFTKFIRYHENFRVALRIIDIDSDSHKRYIDFIRDYAGREVE